MKKGVNLESFRRRYARSSRKGKSKLLDELCPRCANEKPNKLHKHRLPVR